MFILLNMGGQVLFDEINVGKYYDRPQLSKIWGYKGYKGFSRGVFTPSNSNSIVLFVTQEKQSSVTQYLDYINDDFLYWDGEERGMNNDRIINSKMNKTDIHLFYRSKHHQSFIYYGLLEFLGLVKKDILPYEFIFKIIGTRNEIDLSIPLESLNFEKDTESVSQVLSRIGQGKFRVDLFDIWKSCAVTNVRTPEILKASHIKPWKCSNNFERLDPYNGLLLTPNLDSLFDRGFITFENNGQIVISKMMYRDIEVLNLSPNMKLREVYGKNFKYLQYHRDHKFLK